MDLGPAPAEMEQRSTSTATSSGAHTESSCRPVDNPYRKRARHNPPRDNNGQSNAEKEGRSSTSQDQGDAKLPALPAVQWRANLCSTRYRVASRVLELYYCRAAKEGDSNPEPEVFDEGKHQIPPPPIHNNVLAPILEEVARSYKSIREEIIKMFPWMSAETSFPQARFFTHHMRNAAKSTSEFPHGTVSMMSAANLEKYLEGFKDEEGDMPEFVTNFNEGRVVMMIPEISVRRSEVIVYIIHCNPSRLHGETPTFHLYGAVEEHSADY